MKLTICASANCMNKGFFKNYLVRWFYGGKESKKKLFRYVKNALHFGKKKEVSLNEEQIKMLADVADLGFLLLLKNREIEFYKQLSKMRF